MGVPVYRKIFEGCLLKRPTVCSASSGVCVKYWALISGKFLFYKKGPPENFL